MKVTPLKNSFARQRRNSVTLYHGCCCCCCCCILTPVGNLLAEVAVKKVSGHQEAVKKHFGMNLLLAIIAALSYWPASTLVYIIMATGAPGAIRYDFQYFASIPVPFLVYYLLLFFNSKKWMKGADGWQRHKVVLVQWLLSVVLMAFFFGISVGAGFLILIIAAG